MIKKKKILSCSIDDSVFEKLKQIAKNENRSMSNLVRKILKNYVKEKDSCDIEQL